MNEIDDKFRDSPDPKAQLAAILGQRKCARVEAAAAPSSFERVGDTIRVTLYCRAVPKPRMTRSDKWKKRPCVLRYRAFCDALRAAFGPHIPPATSVDRLDIAAHFKPPKSWPKSKRASVIGAPHRQTPDRDNVIKAVQDALWTRDEAIAAGETRKLWDREDKVVIEVRLCQQ